MDKVLITGANGFLGRKLVVNLPHKYVISFDMNDGDIATHDFDKYEAAHVIHLAARTFVPQSWEQPYEYYRVNFMGTLNILEYCRKNNAAMTFISTYMYGAPQYMPIDETHPRSAHSVYNHTKLLGEDLCEFYTKNYGISVTILRLFNVYGEGQRKEFLIPGIIDQALHGEIIKVNDLEPRRDFVYIDDVIAAIKKTIGTTGFHVYNIGSGESRSVLEVIRSICAALEVDKPIRTAGQRRQNEVMNVVADIRKAKQELGWIPKITFDEGIAKTVTSYSREQIS
jgi:nucleoside-diphosphate-sugar epimerase